MHYTDDEVVRSPGGHRLVPRSEVDRILRKGGAEVDVAADWIPDGGSLPENWEKHRNINGEWFKKVGRVWVPADWREA